MRFRGQQSKGPLLAVVLVVLIVVIAAAVYLLYLAPR